MCRANSQGGRRCPACSSPAAQVAHNARRRANRSARSLIVNWGRDNAGLTDQDAALLAVVPVPVAQEWLQNHGGDFSALQNQAAAAGTVPRTSNPVQLNPVYWATPELIDQIHAVNKISALEPDQQLRTGVIVSEGYPDEQGVNHTRRLIFNDQSEGYFKSFEGIDMGSAMSYGHDDPIQPIHEIAASALARKMGDPWSPLVPGCVLTVYEKELGSMARGVEGKPFGSGGVPAESKEAAGFFDALVGNLDRHSGNWLSDRSEMHLIDHGFAFSKPGDGVNMSLLQYRRASNDPQLKPQERAALHAVLADQTTHGLQHVLEPVRLQALRDRAREMLNADSIPLFW